MTATAEMRSGRGRLPGMGAPATTVSPAAPDEAERVAPGAEAQENGAAGSAKPPRSRSAAPKRGSERAGRKRDSEANGGEEPARTSSPAEATPDLPPHAPYAGQAKVQVNPRIYQGIWRRYEELVDELPRQRRRGALTALVNAVLAEHAPRDVDEARAAITWLRQAESRDAPEDRRLAVGGADAGVGAPTGDPLGPAGGREALVAAYGVATLGSSAP